MKTTTPNLPISEVPPVCVNEFLQELIQLCKKYEFELIGHCYGVDGKVNGDIAITKAESTTTH